VSRQKLGQHFLIRGSILDRIAAAACPTPQELVIEIGPGRGALTARLLERAACVVAVEVDPYLAGHLRQKFAGNPRLQVVETDVLSTDFAPWGRAVIAGNLPYYIATPIVEKTVRGNFTRAVFLVQKEVAARLSACPGTGEYGFLTVATRLFAECRQLFEVRPAAFHPPPKVDSAVVLLEPRPAPRATEDPDGFLDFVSRCFLHKRKTIRNNLVGHYGKEVVDHWPEAALRAEQVTFDGFLAMYQRLKPEKE